MNDADKTYKERAIALCESLGINPFEKVTVSPNSFAKVIQVQWLSYAKRLREADHMLKIIGGN